MKHSILIGITALLPFASWAADNYTPLNVKLGLWESSMSNQMSGTPPLPPELLERLTPEQRTRMEEAIKARQAKGTQMHNTKSCLTKDQLDKALTFGNEPSGKCQHTLLSSTSGKQEIRFECNDEKTSMKTSGTVHIEALDSENVKGNAQVAATNGANTMNMQMNFSAKWLGADCGDLGRK